MRMPFSRLRLPAPLPLLVSNSAARRQATRQLVQLFSTAKFSALRRRPPRGQGSALPPSEGVLEGLSSTTSPLA